MPQTILVVEDQAEMRALVRMYLEAAGFGVITTADGYAAVTSLESGNIDLVLLDVMLPGMDGWEVCRRIRQQSHVPIIMVTAKAEEVDRVVGLELGADDYVTKPFSPRELVARVRALLRRVQFEQEPSATDCLRLGGLQIDAAAHKVFLNGVSLDLTPKEFDLLRFFASNVGQVFTREQILTHVWGHACEGSDRMVDALVKRLRRKIESDAAAPGYIETVRGVGYRCIRPGA